MSHKKIQGGFSTVEVIVVIVAVVVLAGVGWMVYQHNRTKATNAEPNTGQQTTNTNKTTNPPADQNVIKIPELGIQITVPDSIKDLTYETKTVTLRNGNKGTIAYFSTASLAAADPGCGTASGPLGSFERADGQYPTQSEDERNVVDYGELVKQFPAFYIAAGSSGSSCSTKPDSTPLLGTYKGDFIAARSTIQASN